MADAPKRVCVAYDSDSGGWAERLIGQLDAEPGAFSFVPLEFQMGLSWSTDEALSYMLEYDALLLLVDHTMRDGSQWAKTARALEQNPPGSTRMVAILVEPLPPEAVLEGFDLLPRDGVPLTHARDPVEGLHRVTEEIRAILQGSAPEAPEAPGPLLVSSSVQAATESLRGEFPARSLVVELINLHPEYGDKTAKLVRLPMSPDAEEATAEEWLKRVRELYDPGVVDRLHGRYVIRGLALLDSELTKPLLDHGFLSRLEDELDPPLLASLSSRGRQLWEPGDVPTLADRPASKDKLRREEFARSLAEMIDEERGRPKEKNEEEKDEEKDKDKEEEEKKKDVREPESFLVQLHGPWGSGKSTLLGFLKEELEDRDWIVVDFNAWQQERLEAPWWSLMTAVHRTSRRALRESGDWFRYLRLLALEVSWQIRLGWMPYLLLPIVAGLLWYAVSNDWFDSATADDGWLAEAADVAKAVGAILSVVVVVFGAVRGLSRSFAAGSAKGADTFLKTSQDPMRTLRRRFEKIVDTAGRPIAVFVDDLDRCQSEYVVEVLQGIQTLLIDAPITYVVAADRRWLFDSYNKIYSDFESVGRDPGRPLGHLFLEKTFQLAASLPSIPSDVRDEYWRGLVMPAGAGEEGADDELARQAERRIEGAGLQGTLEAVQQSKRLSPAEEAATLTAASKRLGDADIQQEVEHRLVPFGHLLEPNPRAMKRLLNAYRIELRRLLAEGRQVGTAAVTPEQLALWTILSMRWPLLADELAIHPEAVSPEGSLADSNGLFELWQSADVQAVIAGEGVPARLTEPAVCALVGARPHSHVSSVA